jgi:hypothetical protein
MNASKPAAKSLTVQSSVLSIVATVVSTALIVSAAPPLAILVPALLGGGLSSLGSLGAIWGRIRATKRITK